MINGLDNFIGSIANAIKTVPEVYEDGLKQAVSESGKTFALIPRAINAALFPLEGWILQKEYKLEEIKKLLEIKLANIEEDKIVAPEPYIAVPVIQALSYSMNNKDLCDLYANLLAKSMIIDTSDSIHPSFVELIKQMSPFDAMIIKKMYISDVISLDISKENTFGRLCVSLDNLDRLGLICLINSEKHFDNSGYNYIRDINIYSSIAADLNNHNSNIPFKSDFIKFTPLGAAFHNICINY